MTNYPEVYKLKENGRIYTWKIELKEYQDKFYTYVTHGQKDGKIIEHIKEIVPKEIVIIKNSLKLLLQENGMIK